MQFKAWLTPEQVDRLEYPHRVSDCRTDQEVASVLIPFDLGGKPQLLVGKDEWLMENSMSEVPPGRETKPPTRNGGRQTMEKPVFMLNAPRPKLPRT